MSYFAFFDESGHDFGESPYMVIAGVLVEDCKLWPLIRELQELEIAHFGIRYSQGERELKAKKILKRKTFKLANQLPLLQKEIMVTQAKKCLIEGESADRLMLTALAQAKISFVKEILLSLRRYNVCIIAAVQDHDLKVQPIEGFLKKEYVFLCERFYYFLKSRPGNNQGIIALDESDSHQHRIFVEQINNYFIKTENGRERAAKIIPEPLFVHSELTTGVQLADLVAYLISWGYRFGELTKPSRNELNQFIELLKPLIFVTDELVNEEKKKIWGVFHNSEKKEKAVLDNPTKPPPQS